MVEKKSKEYIMIDENYMKFIFQPQKVVLEDSHTHLFTYSLWLLLWHKDRVEWL